MTRAELRERVDRLVELALGCPVADCECAVLQSAFGSTEGDCVIGQVQAYLREETDSGSAL